MRIVFADDRLLLLFTREAHKLGLPISVINTARNRLLQMEEADDERTLRNLKSLNFKKLSGKRQGQRSIRVNDQYRIVFDLVSNESPPVIRILEIDDTH